MSSLLKLPSKHGVGARTRKGERARAVICLYIRICNIYVVDWLEACCF